MPTCLISTERLLANQEDIGDAVAAFYGRNAGDALTALLKDHILLAAQLLNAAKAGDQAALTEASEAWYANADDIGPALDALIARLLALRDDLAPFETSSQQPFEDPSTD